MGPVGWALVTASAVVIYVTRRSRDRSVTLLAWFLFLSLVFSLGVRMVWRGDGRATPLMWLDGAALYVTGLLCICRFDGPKWLYLLCTAFLLQCMAHLAYVCFLLPVNAHILILNLLYGVELGALVWGGRRYALHPRSQASYRPRGGLDHLSALSVPGPLS